MQVIGYQKDMVAWPMGEQGDEQDTGRRPFGGAPESQQDELTAQSEEAKPSRAIPRPEMPSQAEIDRHRVDHLPYRAWCPECVEGFGRERSHQAHGGDGRSIPMVSCDYMYVSHKGAFAREELSEEERASSLCVLVAKCSATQCLFAHVVPQKGVDDEGYVVEQLKKDIAWLGHAKVVIRSDNEPAILRMVEKVARSLRASGGGGKCLHRGVSAI